MRILIAAGIYPPDIGGPATYAHALAHALNSRGHSVGVICYSTSRGVDHAEEVTVYRVKRSRFPLVTAAVYLWSVLWQSASVDILYAQGPVAGGIQSLLAGLMFRKPFVVKVTGDYAWEQAQAQYGMRETILDFQATTPKVPYKIRLLRFIQRIVSRRASAVIVPSKFLKELVAGWGVSETRTYVIYNGVSLLNGERQQISETLTKLLSLNVPVVLSVGRLVPWKGFEALVEVWPAINKKYKDAQLCIIGSGSDRERLEKLAEERGVSHVIHFESAPRRAVQAVMEKATALILNSSYEGLSHVLLEAQAAGLPVAASDVGGNSELITHEQTGLLFKYNNSSQIFDALQRLIGDASLRERLGEAAQEFSKKFSESRMHDETEKILIQRVKEAYGRP